MNHSEDESLYRSLVQGIRNYAILMLSPEGIVRNWNLGATRAQGYLAEEIVGKHFSLFYTAEDRQAGLPQKALEKARANGTFEGEGWRIRKDGTKFWAHVVIDSIHDESGELIGFAKVTRDMTAQRESKRAASEQERNFRLLVQGVTDYAIYMLKPDGTVSNWNAGAERAKGYLADEIVGHHFSRFYTPEDRRKGLPERALATALAKGKFEGEGWRIRRDGSRLWAHVVIDPIRDEEGNLIGFAKITRDMSEYKKQIEQVEFIKKNIDLALANMSQGLCVFDEREQLIVCNTRFQELLGFESEISPGDTFVDLLWAIYADEEAEPELVAKKVKEEHERHFEALRLAHGIVTVEQMWNGRNIAANHKKLANGGWVSTLDDVTERKVIEGKITHLAHHDPLTSLPNRASFRHRVDTNLEKNISFALLYLDLDRFKPVNDTLGHPIGDAVLCAVAARIETQLRKNDMGARLGGDEFAILLGGCELIEDAYGVADRIIREIGRPIEIEGHEITIGVSIGIAFVPEHGTDTDLLLRNADLALYTAKENGRSCWRSYEAGMETVIEQRRGLEGDLRRALADREFSLHYQPVLDTKSGILTGFEAILGWNCPTRGNLLASEFVPLAEELGLMTEIGQWTLRMACEEAMSWEDPITISVSLSVTQVRFAELATSIADLLNDIGLAPERLELRITETVMNIDRMGITPVLKKLRELGIQLALDDFGTGNSPLSFLRDLPFTRIKIDRSFISDLGIHPEAAAIVRGIFRLCQSVGVATTADGVETEEQLAILRDENCSSVQGSLIGKPRPAEHLKTSFENYRSMEPLKLQLVG